MANRKTIWIACGVGLLTAVLALVEAQTPGPPVTAGRGGGRASRFKSYPAEAVTRGLPAYNSTCGYCHGDRGKGGRAGPDLIASVVTLHDEDGVQLREFVRGTAHSKVAKVDVSNAQMLDIAAYLHSRIVYASGRGDVHLDRILIGDPKAGERFFNGDGGCAKCHSPTGDMKGVGSKYDPATLQDRVVMPRTGRGGFGRGGAPPANAPFATVTLPSGETVKGAPVRVTDFDVVIRLADGSTKTWARSHGVPKLEITDPLQAHVDIMTRLTDEQMHNLTAYLATLK